MFFKNKRVVTRGPSNHNILAGYASQAESQEKCSSACVLGAQQPAQGLSGPGGGGPSAPSPTPSRTIQVTAPPLPASAFRPLLPVTLHNPHLMLLALAYKIKSKQFTRITKATGCLLVSSPHTSFAQHSGHTRLLRPLKMSLSDWLRNALSKVDEKSPCSNCRAQCSHHTLGQLPNLHAPRQT